MEKKYDIDVEREVLADMAERVCANFMKLIPNDKFDEATEENTPELKYAFAAKRIANKAYKCKTITDVEKLESELNKVREFYK